jgi:solute:Na+ symporter, SSS family
MVVNDFVKDRKKDWDDARMLLVSRGTVALFMVIAALWAPMIANFGGIVEYFQSLLGYLTMPVVVVFLGGLFSARPPRHAAFLTLVTAIPIGLASFVAFEVFELYPLQFLYGTGLMLLLSLGIFLGTTFTSPAPDLGEEQLTFTARTWEHESRELEGKAWYRNHRILGAILVVATLALVVVFI